MAKFEEAEARLFKNVWICQKCNARNRGSEGKKPPKCRKCSAKKLRRKRKDKK